MSFMAEELDFIPLARAAAMVHERLFPEHPTKETKTLDVIALALSTVIPLYRRDMQSGAVQAVSEKELAEGRFTRGATTLEVPYRSEEHTSELQSRLHLV